MCIATVIFYLLEGCVSSFYRMNRMKVVIYRLNFGRRFAHVYGPAAQHRQFPSLTVQWAAPMVAEKLPPTAQAASCPWTRWPSTPHPPCPPHWERPTRTWRGGAGRINVFFAFLTGA